MKDGFAHCVQVKDGLSLLDFWSRCPGRRPGREWKGNPWDQPTITVGENEEEEERGRLAQFSLPQGPRMSLKGWLSAHPPRSTGSHFEKGRLSRESETHLLSPSLPTPCPSNGHLTPTATQMVVSASEPLGLAGSLIPLPSCPFFSPPATTLSPHTPRHTTPALLDSEIFILEMRFHQ